MRTSWLCVGGIILPTTPSLAIKNSSAASFLTAAWYSIYSFIDKYLLTTYYVTIYLILPLMAHVDQCGHLHPLNPHSTWFLAAATAPVST